jgi:uncharacterized membrane protein YqiK
MIIGIAVLFGLIILTVVIQLLTRMKNVPPSQLAVVHGKPGDEGEGFRTFKGGRAFVLPLIHRFSTMDLTPKTTTVVVESAIAKGIVPLGVKATVSFGVATTRRGLSHAVKRILHMTDNWDNLIAVANSIIEGHLRDSLAQMTPEEVMSEKERLVKNMIQLCKSDLEGIGLEITTMNIADVDDYRFEGVQEPDLYIALLKRVQTANADVQSRVAKANARAEATDQEQTRRAEVEVRKAENENEQLEASTKLRVAQERQRAVVGVEQAQRHAEAEVAGILQQIEAEKQNIGMLEAKYQAEIMTPAAAQKEAQILAAQAEAATMRGQVEAELEQIERTIHILQSAGPDGLKAYVIEKFEDLVGSFAGTMDLFPVDHVTVVSGGGSPGPISAIHPNALDVERNRQIEMALAGAAQEADGAAASGAGAGEKTST